MRTNITTVDVDIATGQIITAANPAPDDAIVFRLELEGNIFARGRALEALLLRSKADISTVARLKGTELPWAPHLSSQS